MDVHIPAERFAEVAPTRGWTDAPAAEQATSDASVVADPVAEPASKSEDAQNWLREHGHDTLSLGIGYLKYVDFCVADRDHEAERARAQQLLEELRKGRAMIDEVEKRLDVFVYHMGEF